ncbi:MAG TPA: CoA transferase [bacterium]|nr:CoA transferase [bacterium]
MTRGLEDLRVVEIADDSGNAFSASVAGKLMADLGATVIKIEPSRGDAARRWGPFAEGREDPEASGLHVALNAGKRSLVLDLASPAGQAALRDLAARADLLVHALLPARMQPLGLAYAALQGVNPALVMLSITPYGLAGPHKDFAACELTLSHGGMAWLCPDGSPFPDRPPLAYFGQHALIQAGLHGAAAALAACWSARERGTGEHIDLSIQALQVTLLGRHFPAYTYGNMVESRLTFNVTVPSNFYPCRDGQLFIIAVEEDQWARLVDLMGRPAWALVPELASRPLRGQNRDYLIEHLSEWTRQWSVADLFHACQRQRIGAAPIYTMRQVEEDPHLKEREFFVTHHHPVAGEVRLPGAPYRLSQHWWSLRAAAPRLGEANAELPGLLPDRRPSTPASSATLRRTGKSCGGARAERPLAGVRILDLSWVWAGPHVTLMLAYLGAEVLKIETARRPDLARRAGLYAAGLPPGLNRNGYFNQLNQGKKSLAINLGNPGGLQLALRLAARCDAVVSNFATGVLDRLGLSVQTLQGVKPELIVASISAFGQSGPYAHYAGYGPLIPPIAGLCAATGYEEDGQPRNGRVAYADPNAGIYTAFAILAGLHAREPGQPGLVIETSLWEPLLATCIELWLEHIVAGNLPRPQGNHHPRLAPHNTYRCRGEDAWVAIAVAEDSQWPGLCAALQRPDLAQDARLASMPGRKRAEAELDAILEAWCAPREPWQVTRELQAQGVPAYPCMSSKDILEDVQLNAREFFSRLPHPEVGNLPLAGVPWRLEHGTNGVPGPAPLLGADTEQTLQDLLGLQPAEIEALRRQGAIE